VTRSCGISSKSLLSRKFSSRNLPNVLGEPSRFLEVAESTMKVVLWEILEILLLCTSRCTRFVSCRKEGTRDRWLCASCSILKEVSRLRDFGTVLNML